MTQRFDHPVAFNDLVTKMNNIYDAPDYIESPLHIKLNEIFFETRAVAWFPGWDNLTQSQKNKMLHEQTWNSVEGVTGKWLRAFIVTEGTTAYGIQLILTDQDAHTENEAHDFLERQRIKANKNKEALESIQLK